MCFLCKMKQRLYHSVWTDEQIQEFNERPRHFWDGYDVFQMPAGFYRMRNGPVYASREQIEVVIAGLQMFLDAFDDDDLELMAQECQDPPAEPQRPPREKQVPKSHRPGFVYILRSDHGDYKIGKSLNPSDRMKTFGVQLPFRVEFELVLKADNYTLFEEELHKKFSPKRTKGEWFKLTPDDIEWLRQTYANQIASIEE